MTVRPFSKANPVAAVGKGKPGRLTTGLARALSIVGHPAVLMPCAVVGAAAVTQARPAVLHAAVATCGFVVACVGIYSVIQVRAGRWQHVDASVPHERRQLNGFLALLLFSVAGGLWWAGQPGAVALGLSLGGAVVVVAIGLRHWLKLSLHAAFAVFAAALLWPSVVAVLGVLALAAGVSWSRLVLRRHTRSEVVAGLLAGAAAGVGFRVIAAAGGASA
jgi:hypothetical protein